MSNNNASPLKPSSSSTYVRLHLIITTCTSSLLYYFHSGDSRHPPALIRVYVVWMQNASIASLAPLLVSWHWSGWRSWWPRRASCRCGGWDCTPTLRPPPQRTARRCTPTAPWTCCSLAPARCFSPGSSTLQTPACPSRSIGRNEKLQIWQKHTTWKPS